MAAQSRSSHPGQVMTPRDDGEIDVVDEAHLCAVLALCGALGLGAGLPPATARGQRFCHP